MKTATIIVIVHSAIQHSVNFNLLLLRIILLCALAYYYYH